MSYRDLKARVASAERRLDRHLTGVQDEKQAIAHTLKQTFTPVRLLVAGLAGGAVVGWLRPLSHIGSLSSLARTAAGFPPMFVALMPWLKTVQAVLDTPGPDAGKASQKLQD